MRLLAAALSLLLVTACMNQGKTLPDLPRDPATVVVFYRSNGPSVGNVEYHVYGDLSVLSSTPDSEVPSGYRRTVLTGDQVREVLRIASEGGLLDKAERKAGYGENSPTDQPVVRLEIATTTGNHAVSWYTGGRKPRSVTKALRRIEEQLRKATESAVPWHAARWTAKYRPLRDTEYSSDAKRLPFPLSRPVVDAQGNGCRVVAEAEALRLIQQLHDARGVHVIGTTPYGLQLEPVLPGRTAC